MQRVSSSSKQRPATSSSSRTAWRRTKDSAKHSELLLAALHVAATNFGLCNCVGARIGRAVPSLEGILECSHTLIWWWRTDKPQDNHYFEAVGQARVRLTELFGKSEWQLCSFIQFVMADDDDVNHIRRQEPGVPTIGGLDGPDRPAPKRGMFRYSIPQGIAVSRLSHWPSDIGCSDSF